MEGLKHSSCVRSGPVTWECFKEKALSRQIMELEMLPCGQNKMEFGRIVYVEYSEQD